MMIDIPIEDSHEQGLPVGNNDRVTPFDTAAEDDGHLRALQRLQADFDNYRKRIARERREQSDLAAGEFAKALLPFIDDFDRLISMAFQEQGFETGIKMMYDQLISKLQQLGLEKFAHVGDEFDPYKHEAVATTPVSSGDHNKIMTLMQSGYIFRNKMLRPAQVEVGLFEGPDSRDHSYDE